MNPNEKTLSPAPVSGADPKQHGRWERIQAEFEGAATHVALLPTNQVFAYGGSSLDDEVFLNPPPAEVLDLETLTTRKISMEGVQGDLWCGGHTLLEDGRLLFAGGTSCYPPSQNPLYGGLRQAYIYDPFQGEWERLNDMVEGRWYPTLIRCSDNSVLVISGLSYHDPFEKTEREELLVRVQEVFHTSKGWRVMRERRKFPLYPRLHLLPDGDVFYSGVFNTHFFIPGLFPSARWDHRTGLWRRFGGHHHDKNREEGISMLLGLRPPRYNARVLVAGGGRHNLNRILLSLLSRWGLESWIEKFISKGALESVELLDLSDRKPHWKKRASMHYPRIHANGVLLPDGNVLVVGGMSRHGHHAGTQIPKFAVLQPEMYDLQRDIWTLMDAQVHPRVYHSTALLLPDGRIISMGSNPHKRQIEHSIEIFSPPYLFRGDRPVLVETPENVFFGRPFQIRVDRARQISQVVLVRPEVLTHVTNTDQRLLELNFRTVNQNQIKVEGPPNAHLMPQGYCMLFVLNQDGIPSVSRFLKVA